MEENMKKLTYYVMLGLVAVLCIFMLCIGIRIVTKNVIVEKLNVNNEVTQFILKGVQTADVIDEATGDMFVSIDWEEMYPFAENDTEKTIQKENNSSVIDRYQSKVHSITNVINDYCTTYLMNRTQFVEQAYVYDSVMGWTITPTSAIDGVVFLKNDYLAQIHGQNDVSAITENVIYFKEYLDTQGIQMLYVQAPAKMSMTDKQLLAGMEDYANENADRLLAGIEAKGVNTLDFRPLMYDISEDFYGAFYRTDHHWKTTTAFQMAGILAKYLNEQYGFQFDEEYYDLSHYNVEHYPDYFLGSLGKKVTLAMTEPEDYDLIVPDFDTNFAIQIPERSIELQGNFADTLLDYRHLQKIDYYEENCYASFMNRNDATASIQNLMPTCNEGKRILFIKDSYSTPLIPYIALGVEYVDTLYEIRYTGSVRSYVDSIKPDMVIVMYSADNVSGDGNGRTSVFNLQ